MDYQRKLRSSNTTDSSSGEESNTTAGGKNHATSFFGNFSATGNTTITAILTPLNATPSGKGLSVHVEAQASVVENPSAKKGIKSKPSSNQLVAPTSIKNLTAYVEEEKAVTRTSEIQLPGNKAAHAAPTTSEAGGPLPAHESTAEMQEVEVSSEDNDEEGTNTIEETALAIEDATEKKKVLIRTKMKSDPLSFSQNSEGNQVTNVDTLNYGDLVDEDTENEFPVETKGSPSKEKKKKKEPDGYEGGNVTTVSNDYDSSHAANNTKGDTKLEDNDYVDEKNEDGKGEEKGQGESTNENASVESL